MNVCVHGDSLSGWVVAARLAETGNQVVLRQEQQNHPLDSLREPGLRELVETQQEAFRLTLCDAADFVDSDVHLITLSGGLDGVFAVIDQAISCAQAPRVLMVLTPYPVGCLDQIQTYCDQHPHMTATQSIEVVGFPQFIREGSALTDFVQPWLLVMSGSAEAVEVGRELMRPYQRYHTHQMTVSHRTAELIRLGINAMLATRLSFINELAALAERLDVDIEDVRAGIGADPRIGRDYLEPGCGFGGPTFSDELIGYAQTIHEELDTQGLMSAVIQINESQREILFRKIWRFFRGNIKGRRIAIWGAAFKPNTASVENSVVHPLLHALWAQGCRTSVYDPMANYNLANLYANQPFLEVCGSALEAADGADALAVVTAWDEFSNPDFSWLKAHLRQPVIFDGRNLYTPRVLENMGLTYFAIGRGRAI